MHLTPGYQTPSQLQAHSCENTTPKIPRLHKFGEFLEEHVVGEYNLRFEFIQFKCLLG